MQRQESSEERDQREKHVKFWRTRSVHLNQKC
jgi:hypothetical protein